jgi:hypothetical protein
MTIEELIDIEEAGSRARARPEGPRKTIRPKDFVERLAGYKLYGWKKTRSDHMEFSPI